MSVSIEVFKQAFASTLRTEPLPNDDARTVDALNRLNQLVAGLSAPDAERFQRVLMDLLASYQSAKTRTAGGQASGAMAEVLRNTQAVIARAEAATAAGNASAELAPAPVGPASAERKDLPSVPGPRFRLQFNVQHLGEMIANARVRIADQERVTDNRGMVEFDLAPGDHAYHVVAEGYAELSGTVEVSAASNVERHGVLLTPLDPRRAGVVIRVLNVQTRQPVPSALVRLGNSLEHTNSNGEARFVGVARVRDPYLGSIQLRGFQTHAFAFNHNGSDDPAVRVVELEPNGEPMTGDVQPESPPTGDGPYEQVTLQFSVQGGRRWIAGATVRIADASRVTDAGGMSEFMLAPGNYSYAVSAESYAELTGRVEVSAAAAMERHAVVLNPLNVERTQVIVRVLDARTRRPIDAAFVAFGSEFDRTSSTGEVRFIGIPRGDAFLRYEVRANGYQTIVESFQNYGTDDPVSLTVELQPVDVGENPVLINVVVTVADARSGQPVAAADVTVGGHGGQTDNRGTLSIMVPPGTYEVRVSATGFDPAVHSISVVGDQTQDQAVRIALQPTVLQRPDGNPIPLFTHVIDDALGTPVELATVVVEGDRTYQPAGVSPWIFTLPSPGRYQYRAAAPGFAGVSGSVSVSASPPAELWIRLQRQPITPVSVTVMVTDAATNNAVAGATVDVNGQTELTGNTGVAILSLTSGKHDYRVTANGYATATGLLEVQADGQSTWQIQLQPASTGSPNGPSGEPNVPGGEPNLPGGGPNVPGGGAAPNPLRDRTLRRRLAVPSDFAAFRAAVVDWIGTVVVAERAGPLVDASNLRELHPNLSGSAGQEKEITALLCTERGWRYDLVHFSVPGVRRAAPAADAPVGQVPPTKAPKAEPTKALKASTGGPDQKG